MPVYDFSSGLNLLNQGINTLGSALGNRADTQAYAGIGDALSRGDYQGAAARAWQMGKPDLALKLQSQAMVAGAAGAPYPSETGGAPAAPGQPLTPTQAAPASLKPDGTPDDTGTSSAGFIKGSSNAAHPSAFWGNPSDPGFEKTNLTTITTPGGQTAQVNTQAAPAFQGFLGDLEARGYKINSLGGYNNRDIAGTSTLSQHAYGNAIDINPGANPVSYGERKTDLPADVSDLAAKWGITWGGDWQHKKDSMHFEWTGLGGTGGFQQGGVAGQGGQPGGSVPVQGMSPGMLNNNPFNLKYSATSAKLPGVVGPSKNTDQGDPQVVFNTPSAGVAAANHLALQKYQGGQTSAMSLIAGQNGWTPGNTQAATNVARLAGFDPNEDMHLDQPQNMQRFLSALATQESGQSARGIMPLIQQLGGRAAPGPQAGGVGALNLPRMPGPQGGAVPAALPPPLGPGGPAPGTPGPGKPGELGTPVPGPAAQPPGPPTDPTLTAGGIPAPRDFTAGANPPLIPGLIPEQGGFGDQPPRQRPPADTTFTDPLTGLRMPTPPARPATPAAPVPGGPPGYSAARTGAGAASEADPRAVAGVARDVPAVHTPATVPASIQPKSSPSAPVQGPAGPAGPRPSQAEQQRFLGPAASNAAADFGVAPSAIRGAPQAPAPMPPSTAATRAPFPAMPGGPGGPVAGPGAPGPAGGGNPVMALLQSLGIAPGPQGGAQQAALPPGGPPPGAQAPGPAPQAGGGGPGVLGGLLNMLSMQPPGGVPGLQSPASSLGYGAPRPMPGQPGFPGGAPPPLAGGAPGPVMAGGPGAAPGAPGAPGAVPAQAGAPPTAQQVQQQANAAVTQGSQYTDIPTLTRLRDQQRTIAQRVSLWSPELAKPLEESANHLDDRINDLIKQQSAAGYKGQELTQQSQKEQATALSGKFADQHAKLTGASGVQASLENINAMEGNLQEAARGMGKAQDLGETVAGLLAPFDPHFAGLAAGSQEFNARATQEMIQMANQLFAQGRLNRTEFNAIRDGTFTLGDRPDVVYDMLELARHRALLLAENHNDQLQRFKKNYGPYGGNQTADQFQVDIPKELTQPGDRAAITGTGGSADKPLRVHNPDDLKGLKSGTWVMRPDGQVKQIGAAQ